MSSKIFAFSNCDDNFKKIQELTCNHNKKYFSKHNIEYEIYLNNLQDSIFANKNNATQYHCYIKFLKLQELMYNRNDIDYFFVFDSDIIICDFNIDIRIFPKLSSKSLLVCSVLDCSVDMFWNVNAGSIIIRNCEVGKQIINNYLKIAKYYNYDINDQVLLQTMLRQDDYIQKNTAVFPHDAFNHGNIECFLYHECGISTSNRDLQYCLSNKYDRLKTAIDKLNIN